MNTLDHDNRVKILKQIVDEASVRLVVGGLSIDEAERILQRVRNQAELLLPEQMETFDLIYQSRLRRLIDQFIRPSQLAR